MSNNPCNINWTNPAEVLTKGPACLWQGIQSLPQTIVGGIMGAINTLWSTIDNVGRNVFNALSGIFSGIVNFFQNVGQWITNIGAGIWAGLQSLGAWIWGGIQQLGSMIFGGIQWLVDRITNFINESSKWILDRLGDLRTVFDQFFKDGVLGSFLSWIESTIASPIKSFVQNIYDSIKKHVVEVVIHNLPAVISAFVMGELLYRMPMMLERDQIHALEALVMAPIVVPLSAYLFNDILKRKGVIGAPSVDYKSKTYREVRQISEAQKETVSLSQRGAVRISVYLVKEMTELVQGIGKARIIQMQVRSPAAEYDVGLMASATISRATVVQASATIRATTTAVATAAVAKTVTASKGVSISRTGSAVAAKIVTATKAVSISKQGTATAPEPVTATTSIRYTSQILSGALIPMVRIIGGADVYVTT